MKVTGAFVVTLLAAALLTSGCAKKESAVDKAVDSTKDALDMRDHEKLKDAGEDAKKAIDDTAAGVKDAADGK